MTIEDAFEQAGARLAAIDLEPYRAQLEEAERERAELEEHERAARAEHAEVSATLRGLGDTRGSPRAAARAWLQGSNIGQALNPRPEYERQQGELRKAADGLSEMQKGVRARKRQLKDAPLPDMAAALQPVLEADEQAVRSVLPTLLQAFANAAAIELATDSAKARELMRRTAGVLNELAKHGWIERLSIQVNPQLVNALDLARDLLDFVGRPVRKTVPFPIS